MRDNILIPQIAVILIMGFVTYVALQLAAIGVEAPYLLYLLAVAFCYLVGSIATAVSAVLIGGVSTWYFFIPPAWSFNIPSLKYNITLLLFVSVAIIMCAIIYDLSGQIEELTEENKQLSAKYRQVSARAGQDPGQR